MIKNSVAKYPNPKYTIEMLVADEETQTVAARVLGTYGRDHHEGRDMAGSIWEYVFYQFRNGKIMQVWALVK
jgi:predicted ester cyclase